MKMRLALFLCLLCIAASASIAAEPPLIAEETAGKKISGKKIQAARIFLPLNVLAHGAALKQHNDDKVNLP